jgi:hypothetical protein
MELSPIYIIINRHDPLGAFHSMEVAFEHALQFSRDWVQPLRVFMVPADGAIVPPRLLGTFRGGRQLVVKTAAQR